jgi:D-arabinose 1-dehydrogenase-like Zn-dependent alcohol dehydrogenase
MKSLRKTRAAQGLELQQAERPAPGQTEVLIEVKATGVCGSDLHIDEWTPSYHFMAPALPLTIGHEFCGLVAELGSGVQGLELGQLVTVRPSVVCGVCPACTAGRCDDCVTRRGIGVMRDGAFAPWVRVPARNCVPVPQDLDPRVAALAEPLSVGWEAVRKGKPALVFGHAWYASLPGVHTWHAGLTHADIVDHPPAHSALEQAAGQLLSQAHAGIISRHYATLVPDHDEARNTQAVAQALLPLLLGQVPTTFG